MPDFLTRNLTVKVLALLVALFLWAVVNGQREELRQIDVPLVLPELADSLTYLEHPGESVSVTFRAPAGRLFWFRLAPPVLAPVFSLSVTDTTQTVTVRQDFLDLPRQFEGSVLDFTPDFLRVRIGEMGELELPVLVEVGRSPLPPWRLRAQPRALPGRVTVRGPLEILEHMRNRRVHTEPLDLQGLEGIVVLEAELINPNPRLEISPERVEVEVLLENTAAEAGDLDLPVGAP